MGFTVSGSGASSAPASHAAPMGRATPRWSVPVAHVGAMSMAGLPVSNATVCVGPPLFARATNSGVPDTTLLVVVPVTLQPLSELKTS